MYNLKVQSQAIFTEAALYNVAIYNLCPGGMHRRYIKVA